MLNSKLYLNQNLFKKDVELKHTRSGFGEGLLEIGKKNEKIVVLTANLKESTKVDKFAEEFPERFFEVGVAEQALATIASGLANYGKIPFISSYAVFSPGRNWEQIRTTIAIDNFPVKIIGAQSGLNVGHYGVTHQALEDIALMRVLPNITVVVPFDFEEAKKATIEISKVEGPCYLRLDREPSVSLTSVKTPFKIGKAEVIWEPDYENAQLHAAIIGAGPVLYNGLLAALDLAKSGIEVMVINSHTIKPLDEATIIKAAKICASVVTVEEHQTMGGLGSAVSEVLSKNFPVPIEMVGVNDRFGQSGDVKELYKEYKLTKEDIIKAVKKVIARKNNE